MTINSLTHWNVEGARLERGMGSLACIHVSTPLCTGELYLHGAHVAAWQPHGQPHPIVWVSSRALFAPGKPIRGGVPICFPWFGPNASRPEAPMHGFARTQEWKLVHLDREDDGTLVARLLLEANDVSRAFEVDHFSLEYTVRFGTTLDLALVATNTGDRPVRFEEALHTYLAVSDARHITVTGLGGAEYYDKTDGMKRKRQEGEIALVGETDRLYVNTTTEIVLDDPGWERRVTISKTGSHSTVVWNPWVARSAAIPDFGDDEWPGMTCIETVNAAENAVELAAGGRHEMTARISVAAR